MPAYYAAEDKVYPSLADRPRCVECGYQRHGGGLLACDGCGAPICHRCLAGTSLCWNCIAALAASSPSVAEMRAMRSSGGY